MYFRRQGILPIGQPSAGTPAQGVLALSASSASAAFFTDDSALQTLSAITLTGTGTGTLAGPQFSSNKAWLTTSVTRDSGGWTIYPIVDISGLSAGVNSGTITISDSNASNSPLTISVSITITAAVPIIALSSQIVSLSATAGVAGTSASVTASNGGRSTMATPTIGTITGTGASYVSAAVSGSGPWAILISSNAAGAAAGSYNFTIPIVSSGASNTPQNITGTLVVTAAALGQLDLSKSVVDAQGTIGGADPAADIFGVYCSTNGVSLAGPTIQSTTYGGTHSGWATPTLTGVSGSIGYSLTGISTSCFAWADVAIADANCGNTQTIRAYLKVSATTVAASLATNASSVSRSVFVGNNAATATVNIYNVGSGGLAALGTIGVSFSGSPSWISSSYNSTTGDLTLTFTTSGLSANTYNTNMTITGSTAVNGSPTVIPIQVIVSVASVGTWPVPSIPTPPSGTTWDATKGYLTGSVFNTLATYRAADNGAMPAFTGTEYIVTNQTQWNTVYTGLLNGTIVDGDIITISTSAVLTNIQLPLRPGWTEGTSGFVWIRTSSHASLPDYSYADGPASYDMAHCVDRSVHLSYMPVLQTTTVNVSAICPQGGSGGYWFTGMNFAANTPSSTFCVVNLSKHVGTQSQEQISPTVVSDWQRTLADVPSCWVFDRCIWTTASGGAQNHLINHGRYVRVVHCDIGEARWYQPPSGRLECHALMCYNSDGKHEVMGNRYAAVGIGAFYGGAKPKIPNVVPTDLVYMWNKIWGRPNAQAEYDTQVIKNAMEFKTGKRAVFAFNDLRYWYLYPNQRFAILIKPTDQGNTGYPAECADIAVWCNRLRDSAKGLCAVTDSEASTGSTGVIGTSRVEVGYNFAKWDSTYSSTYYGTPALSEQRSLGFDRNAGNGVDTLRMHHNTFSGQHHFSIGPEVNALGTGWRNFELINNVQFVTCTYGAIFCSGGVNSGAMDARLGPGNWSIKRNYTINGGTGKWSYSYDTVLGNAANANAYLTINDFANPAAGNYSLLPSTSASASYAGGGGGTDGKDCGYDYNYMVAMLADLGV